MTRRWTPMETSLISRKIAVCSTVFNLFIQLNVIQVTNKSSDFCACIRKNYGETLMFRSMFSRGLVRETWRFQLREWLEWPIWIRQKMGNDFSKLDFENSRNNKNMKMTTTQKMRPSWWSLITFGDSFLTHVPQLGGHVFSNDPMIEKWKLSIHGWKLVPTALTLKDTSFFQTWNPYVKL